MKKIRIIFIVMLIGVFINSTYCKRKVTFVFYINTTSFSKTSGTIEKMINDLKSGGIKKMNIDKIYFNKIDDDNDYKEVTGILDVQDAYFKPRPIKLPCLPNLTEKLEKILKNYEEHEQGTKILFFHPDSKENTTIINDKTYDVFNDIDAILSYIKVNQTYKHYKQIVIISEENLDISNPPTQPQILDAIDGKTYLLNEADQSMFCPKFKWIQSDNVTQYEIKFYKDEAHDRMKDKNIYSVFLEADKTEYQINNKLIKIDGFKYSDITESNPYYFIITARNQCNDQYKTSKLSNTFYLERCKCPASECE